MDQTQPFNFKIVHFVALCPFFSWVQSKPRLHSAALLFGTPCRRLMAYIWNELFSPLGLPCWHVNLSCYGEAPRRLTQTWKRQDPVPEECGRNIALLVTGEHFKHTLEHFGYDRKGSAAVPSGSVYRPTSSSKARHFISRLFELDKQNSNLWNFTLTEMHVDRLDASFA